MKVGDGLAFLAIAGAFCFCVWMCTGFMGCHNMGDFNGCGRTREVHHYHSRETR